MNSSLDTENLSKIKDKMIKPDKTWPYDTVVRGIFSRSLVSVADSVMLMPVVLNLTAQL